MKEIRRYFSNKGKRRFLYASLISAFISYILTIVIVNEFGSYGIGLFILIPFLLGFLSTIILGQKERITFRDARQNTYLSLGIFLLGLLLTGFEGFFCILMVLPLAMLISYGGTYLAYRLLKTKQEHLSKLTVILILSIPLTAFVEKDAKPKLYEVKTMIEIEATSDKVWKSVVSFPKLKEPIEYLFRAGIAYPIDATIKGEGVGSVRYCNFTTGSFIEPVTVWEENKLLKFDVEEQPAPMKEISFWDVDAPHLHDYFISKRGQFKLTTLSNGNTLLEGSTWYYNKIRPNIYWNLWSNYIVHKIHNRVLEHIKECSEYKTDF